VKETHKTMISDHRTMISVEKEEYENLHPHLNPPPPQGGGRKKVPFPSMRGKVYRARELRKRLTNAEKELWKHIRLRQIAGHKFRRQQPIGTYIADFACLEKKLVVEVDGGQHSEQSSYDEERTAWLESQGYRVLRFWNNEVLKEIEIVLDVIAKVLEEDE